MFASYLQSWLQMLHFACVHPSSKPHGPKHCCSLQLLSAFTIHLSQSVATDSRAHPRSSTSSFAESPLMALGLSLATLARKSLFQAVLHLRSEPKTDCRGGKKFGGVGGDRPQIARCSTPRGRPAGHPGNQGSEPRLRQLPRQAAALRLQVLKQGRY